MQTNMHTNVNMEKDNMYHAHVNNMHPKTTMNVNIDMEKINNANMSMSSNMNVHDNMMNVNANHSNLSSNNTTTLPTPPTLKLKKKKITRRQKKAPGAPKRGKSPYIIFSMKIRNDVKKRLPSTAKVTDIVRAIAVEWQLQSHEDRIPYEAAAAVDKARYEDEMATYDGPLHVLKKKPATQQEVPKRPTGAFTFFSQIMRKMWLKTQPDLHTSEIMKELSMQWKGCDKKMYMEMEKEDKVRFEMEMEFYTNEKEKKSATLKKQDGAYTPTVGGLPLEQPITVLDTIPTACMIPYDDTWNVAPSSSSIDSWLLDPIDALLLSPMAAVPMPIHLSQYHTSQQYGTTYANAMSMMSPYYVDNSTSSSCFLSEF